MANLTCVVPREQQVEISLAGELAPVFGNRTDTLSSLTLDPKSHLMVDFHLLGKYIATTDLHLRYF